VVYLQYTSDMVYNMTYIQTLMIGKEMRTTFAFLSIRASLTDMILGLIKFILLYFSLSA
jgi:hypothetical protein